MKTQQEIDNFKITEINQFETIENSHLIKSGFLITNTNFRKIRGYLKLIKEFVDNLYDVLNISINKIKEKYESFEEAKNNIDFFAITVGIIMHDISKSSIKRNEENLSHSQMMAKNPEYIVAEVYDVLELMESQVGIRLLKEVKENIAHIVLSHHGKWGKIQPETEEAKIVFIADMESAKYHRINPIQANDILKLSVQGMGLTEIEKEKG